MDLFLRKYYNLIFYNLTHNNKNLKNLILLEKKIKKIKKINKKIIVIANGGSLAIANHVALDLSNSAKIITISFSDASLITCLTNDYGYENFYTKALDIYSDFKDGLIAISSSGMSKNIINAVKKNKKKFSFIATFTGFNKNNLLKKLSNLSFHVESNNYNIIETVHQIWLLSLEEKIAKKKL